MGRGRQQSITSTPTSRVRTSAKTRSSSRTRSSSGGAGRINNQWTRRTFASLQDGTYITDLDAVYPTLSAAEEEMRTIPADVWGRIESAYHRNDEVDLLAALMDDRVPRWPGEKPAWVSTVIGMAGKRSIDETLRLNPAVVTKAMKHFEGLSLESIHYECCRPPAASRRRGQQFRSWLAENFSSTRDVSVFMASEGPIALDAGDEELKRFCEERLGYRGSAGLDGVIKAGERFIVIEAKLITESGGGQNHQVAAAMTLNKRGLDTRRAIPVAVIDGVALVQSGTKIHMPLRKTTMPVLNCRTLAPFVAHIHAGGHPGVAPRA